MAIILSKTPMTQHVVMIAYPQAMIVVAMIHRVLIMDLLFVIKLLTYKKGLGDFNKQKSK